VAARGTQKASQDLVSSVTTGPGRDPLGLRGLVGSSPTSHRSGARSPTPEGATAHSCAASCRGQASGHWDAGRSRIALQEGKGHSTAATCHPQCPAGGARVALPDPAGFFFFSFFLFPLGTRFFCKARSLVGFCDSHYFLVTALALGLC
jgi:hypothetical protein